MKQLLECRYKEGGRTFPEYDCYGLVLAARKLMGLPELPEYSEIRKGEGMHNATMESLHLCQPSDPRPGAVALCWHLRMVRHIAVVVEADGRTMVMEINPDKNVTLSTVDAFNRRYRRVEYYY